MGESSTFVLAPAFRPAVLDSMLPTCPAVLCADTHSRSHPFPPHLEALSLDVDAELGDLLAHVERQVEVVELLLPRAEGHLDRHPPVGGEEGGRRRHVQDRAPAGVVVHLSGQPEGRSTTKTHKLQKTTSRARLSRQHAWVAFSRCFLNPRFCPRRQPWSYRLSLGTLYFVS